MGNVGDQTGIQVGDQLPKQPPPKYAGFGRKGIE